MFWHDCKIYAIAFDEFNYKLMFDLDISLESILGTIIESLERANPSKPNNSDYINKDIEWEWTIETRNGVISFKSVGYTQYVRKAPVYKKAQEIDFKERGGYSFSVEYIE